MGDDRPSEYLTGLVELGDREIAHADVVDQAILSERIEFWQRRLGVIGLDRAVDVQQIHGIEAQTVEALLGALPDVRRREAVGPDLRGHRQILAGHVGPGNPLTDALLVLVDLCGVEVTIAQFDRAGDHVGVLDSHRPEADRG